MMCLPPPLQIFDCAPGSIHPAVSKIRKMDVHVRTCSCAPPLTSIKTWRLMGFQPLTEFQRNPSSCFRDKKKGAHMHVQIHLTVYIMAYYITYVICIAAWSLNTHQIWSLSAKPFLSYSSAINFGNWRGYRVVYMQEVPLWTARRRH